MSTATCPECGEPLLYPDGCLVCGWTRNAPRVPRAHPPIPVPPTVPEQTAARFTGPTITPEETP